MKYITLIFLIIFMLVISGIFSFNFIMADKFNNQPLPSEISNSNTADRENNNNQNNINTQEIINSNVNSKKITNIKPILNKEGVSKYSSVSDCYLIINNKVYDVSSFISSHPGGAEKIIDNCGQEASGLFAYIHSNFAWDLLKKYYIGDLSLK